MNKEMKWIKHADSQTHLACINFLYSLTEGNIGTDLQGRGKAYLKVCQERNRYFFANALILCTKFLARKRTAFHGNITGEGNITDLIKLVYMHDKSIKDQMCVTRRDLHLVKPVHSTNILFYIDKMARQLKEHIMEVL